MSVVLTPNNTRSVVKSPVNGDAADASTLTSETTQPIVNNDGFNFLASYGVCGALMVSSIDGVNLTVGALGAVRTTTLVLSTTAPATFSAATKLGGALANSARYYLYAYSNAGTLDYQVSTTAPQANRLYKTGSDDHALLSTFSTDSSGIILPYSQRGNDYTYAVPKISAALTANTWTDLDLNTAGVLVPAGCMSTTLRLQLTNGAGSADTFSVRAKGITASGYTGASAAYPCPATSDVVTGDILLPCNSSQVIQYKWTTGTSTDGRVFVAGFRW